MQYSSHTSSVPQHSPNQFVAHLKTTKAESSLSPHYPSPVSHQNKSSVIVNKTETTQQVESEIILTSSRTNQDTTNDINDTSFTSADNYRPPNQYSKPYTAQCIENNTNPPSTVPAPPLIEQIQSNLKKLKHSSPKMAQARTNSGNKSNLKIIQGSPYHTSTKAAKTLEQQLHSLRRTSINCKTTSFEPSAPVSEWRQKSKVDGIQCTVISFRVLSLALCINI